MSSTSATAKKGAEKPPTQVFLDFTVDGAPGVFTSRDVCLFSLNIEMQRGEWSSNYSIRSFRIALYADYPVLVRLTFCRETSNHFAWEIAVVVKTPMHSCITKACLCIKLIKELHCLLEILCMCPSLRIVHPASDSPLLFSVNIAETN